LLGGEPDEAVPPEELFERLQPFKERVAADIRRTSPTTNGPLRAGRYCAAAPLGGLAAPARDRVARGGDAAEPGEQPERKHVQGRNPDPTQHAAERSETAVKGV